MGNLITDKAYITELMQSIGVKKIQGLSPICVNMEQLVTRIQPGKVAFFGQMTVAVNSLSKHDHVTVGLFEYMVWITRFAGNAMNILHSPVVFAGNTGPNRDIVKRDVFTDILFDDIRITDIVKDESNQTDWNSAPYVSAEKTIKQYQTAYMNPISIPFLQFTGYQFNIQ